MINEGDTSPLITAIDLSTLISKDELWSLFMNAPNNMDLLRSILRDGEPQTKLPAPAKDIEVRGAQALVFTSCTVTIHQHIAMPASKVSKSRGGALDEE